MLVVVFLPTNMADCALEACLNPTQARVSLIVDFGRVRRTAKGSLLSNRLPVLETQCEKNTLIMSPFPLPNPPHCHGECVYVCDRVQQEGIIPCFPNEHRGVEAVDQSTHTHRKSHTPSARAPRRQGANPPLCGTTNTEPPPRQTPGRPSNGNIDQVPSKKMGSSLIGPHRWAMQVDHPFHFPPIISMEDIHHR